MIHLRSIEACIVHISFYKLTLSFGTLHMCAQNALHPFSYQANRTFSLWPFLWFISHGVLPWAHHVFVA